MSETESGSNERLNLLDLIDLERIQSIQDAFSDATGLASIITDTNGTPLTRPSNFCRLCNLIRTTDTGLANCIKSDSLLGRENKTGVVIRPCLSSGLWDGGASIRIGEQQIANWLIGQVRTPEMDEEALLSYAVEIGIDPVEYKAALKDVTAMSSDRFKSICDFLYIMANQISDLAYANILEKKASREKEELLIKLNQKSKMDALGQLTGGIAHDFNNMLTGIMGASEFLESKMADRDFEYSGFLQMITESAKRAADLTDKLLTFSRKSDKEFKLLDIHRIIDDSVAILKGSIDKRIVISTEKLARKALVTGSVSDIENALINLGINASHAMKETGGELIIQTSDFHMDQDYIQKNHLDLEAGYYIRITVKDTGCGIPAENMDRIFEPFFTTKDRGEGTGLGLSTVYGMIENHRGAISVSSKKGVGTKFFLYFPLPNKSVEPSPENKTKKRAKSTGHVYLIDDERAILRTVSANLKELGYEVTAFENTTDALASFEQEHINVDLILTDLVMPDGNGAELFYKMKEIDPACKVILSSGFSQSIDLERLMADGLTAYLHKPFSIDELSLIVNKAISS